MILYKADWIELRVNETKIFDMKMSALSALRNVGNVITNFRQFFPVPEGEENVLIDLSLAEEKFPSGRIGRKLQINLFTDSLMYEVWKTKRKELPTFNYSGIKTFDEKHVQ